MIWALIILGVVAVIGWVLVQGIKSWQSTNILKQRFDHLKSLEDRSSNEELLGNKDAANRYAQLAQQARTDLDKELNS